MKKIKLTEDLINNGGTFCSVDVNGEARYSWNKKQLQAIGVDYPAKKGWKQELSGKEVDEHQYNLFLELNPRRVGGE